MNNMSDIMQHKPVFDEDDPRVKRVPNPNFGKSSTEEISAREVTQKRESQLEVDQSTGMTTVKENFNPVKRPGIDQVPDNITPDMIQHVGTNATPQHREETPKAAHPTFIPPNVEDEGEYYEEKIEYDSAKVAEKARQKVIQNHSVESQMGDIFADALNSEKAREKSAEQITSDPEAYRDKILAAGDIPESEVGMKTVVYDGTSTITETRTDITAKKQKEVNPVGNDMEDEMNDLVPSYTKDEDEEKEPVAADDELPDPADEDGYREYIRNLEVVNYSSEDSIVKTVRNRQLNVVPSGRNKTKFLNDQAFINNINKYKKDNFPIVAVPLVNSGFVVDIVGTGIVDLTQLYTRVDENTTRMEYEIEKMRTIIRSVVRAHPYIDPMQLRNMIHFYDYNLMAYAHICATLEEVEMVDNCDECGKPFRIKATSSSLLINKDEIEERAKAIEEADDINRFSLLTFNVTVETRNGFEVTLGHPSYAEYIKLQTDTRDYASKMDPIARSQFISVANQLYYIRKIKMTNNVTSSNIYQHYLAISTMSDEDFDLITDQIEKMQKSIMIPKFGIAKVTCPHCHTVKTNIQYSDLTDLVFYHSMVSTALKGSPKNNETME